jgi:uncharacterized protein YdeI (BOF family)
MKTKSYICLILLAVAAAIVITGCRQKNKSSFGQQMSNENATKVSTILTKPTDFNGKTVTIEGKIIRECPSGCWLDVQQDSAYVHVDLNPSGFAIPQKTGSSVKVQGPVTYKDGQVQIVGQGVEIK